MEIAIATDRVGLGRIAAQRAVEILKNALQSQPVARLIVATGSSQFDVLEALVSAQGVDWSRVEGFHLDEYIGLDRAHPASFCGYLAKRFVDRVPLRSFHFLDGSSPPQEVCENAAQVIQQAPIDLALVGIGENAHLAFNDPPADFTTKKPYLIVELDEACRRQQVGEGWFDTLEQVPRRAISMSVHQIMASKNIVCSVPDRRKAQAVADSLCGPIDANVPASILQTHSSVLVVLDEASAEKLDPRVRAGKLC